MSESTETKSDLSLSEASEHQQQECQPEASAVPSGTGPQYIDIENPDWPKKEFLARLSHEVRTSMSVILGASEMQLQKAGNPSDTEEALGLIYDSGHLLLSNINDLLDLSTIEEDGFELIPEKYDIPSLVNDTMQLSPLRFDNKPIEFLLTIDEDTPYDLYGDDHRVKQILNNILSNAYKFTERGRVELSISAEPQSEASGAKLGLSNEFILVLRVSDTGHGMLEEQTESLFRDDVRFGYGVSYTSFGKSLGLSVTKRLVDAMHGEILVESQVDKGSVFTVRLPQGSIGATKCGPDLADELRGRRFQSMSKSKSAHTYCDYMPYGSVLIVDDFESNRNVAKSIMLNYGLNIETAASGFEALDKIKNGSVYDIVFMDYMMPKMDGLETTKKLRDLGYTQPIVALTANVVLGQEELFIASGCDEHMYKPIDTRELDHLLNRLIRDKQPPEVVEAAREETRKKKASEANSLTQQALIFDELIAAAARDAENAIQVLSDVLFRMSAPSSTDVELFVTTVHGMKNSLANINEIELMGTARKLEKAGINKVLEIVLTETPPFIEELRAFIDKSRPAHTDEVTETSPGDAAFLQEKMYALKNACMVFDIRTARTIMTEVKAKAWPHELKNSIDEISVSLIHGDFNKAIADAQRLADAT